MAEFKYIELVTGSASNRGNFVESNTIHGLDYYGKKSPIEAYSSVYLHCEDFVNHKDAEGKRRGYMGAVKADGLHFDIDSVNNLQGSMDDTRRLIERICEPKTDVLIDHVHIWYSGSKGFHVFVVNEEISGLEASEKTSEIIKRLAIKFANTFECLDTKIYDRSRLWRIANSINKKSGLHKIPLFAMELWDGTTIDDIKDMAKQQRSLKACRYLKK